jgi:NtrC-family two-component system sensor histidine kinase KinB
MSLVPPSLRARFWITGGLLATMTLANGTAAAVSLVRLRAVVDRGLELSHDLIDLGAEMQTAIEREDDALLAFIDRQNTAARRQLEAARGRGDGVLTRLQRTPPAAGYDLEGPIDRLSAAIAAYRRAADELLAEPRAARSDPPATGRLTGYLKTVNPRLQTAVSGCDAVRSAAFAALEAAGIQARDEARLAGWLLVVLGLVALVLAAELAAWMHRSVLRPLRLLAGSLEAAGRGDFEQRAEPATATELERLTEGFNRMAEALADYKRSSLGELLTAKMTLESSLHALPDAVLIFDPAGHLADANPRGRELLKALGLPREPAIADLPLSPADRSAIETALAGNQPQRAPAEFPDTLAATVRGQPRRFLLTAAPIPEMLPGRFGAAVVFDDVTDFARLDELRSELIGMASHELKSPLTTLRMNLLMLGEDRFTLPARQAELVVAAIDACEDLGITIEELLDVTRIEASQLRLDLAPIDLSRLLATTALKLRERFTDAGVTLTLENAVDPALVVGDVARLASVIGNVLGNALKYSPRGGTVQASMERSVADTDSLSAIRLIIDDEGPGVPPEYRERIFEKFFRVEHQQAGSTTTARGTGIGLYLCREIIKAHDGTIRCGRPVSGAGTRIEIQLPVPTSGVSG